MSKKKIFQLRLREFSNHCKNFGFGYALYGLIWWVCFYLRPPFAYKLSSFAMRKKTEWLDKYVTNQYGDIINRYKQNPPIAEPVEDIHVWVFWGQSRENMPPLIEACYRQLTYFNSNVTLITEQNVHEYIALPAVVFEKLRDGRITWAHFSDIVRNTLLARYGGLWLDATVWVSGVLPMDRLFKMNFFTANGVVPVTRSSVRFWTSYEWNWSSWCLWTKDANYLLFSFVSDMLQAIAVREYYWPDYVIQDYLIHYACRTFPEVKEDMEYSQEWQCKHRNDLALLMSQPYDESKYRELTQTDFFFKLSFRTCWKEEVDGKPTFYGRILSDIIDIRK